MLRTELPPQHTRGPYRIALVCLGNICRSPTAHVVLDRRLADAGLADAVSVSSAGTADWHVGKAMDHRSAATLEAAGYDPSRHRARHYGPEWTETHDLVLVMDRANLADVGGPAERVAMFRDFDPDNPGAEVPDPYYGGDDGFKEVLAMVERTSDHMVSLLAQHLSDRLGDSAPGPA